MAPDSPGLHFTIARAYQRAGRLEDAAREREEFTGSIGSPARSAAARSRSAGISRSRTRRLGTLRLLNRLADGYEAHRVSLATSQSSLFCCLALAARPGTSARRRHRQGRRDGRPRRRRRARQARPAGAGSHRGRLRAVRGRCAAEDRLVHANPGSVGGTSTPAAAAPAPAARRRRPRRRVESTRARRSPPSSSTGSSLENRKRAVQAAQSYLGDKEEMQNYVGIFGIDLSLRPLVPFTRNGVARAPGAEPDGHGQQPGSQLAGDAAAARRRRVRRRRRPPTRRTAPRPARARGIRRGRDRGRRRQARGDAGQHRVRLPGNRAQPVRVHRRPTRWSRSSHARPAAGPQERGPLFRRADDPDPVARLFSGVIDAANRANVSIYTIDAAGLRAVSEQQKVRDMVVGAGAASEGGFSADGGGGSLHGWFSKPTRTRSATIPATLLKQLALETGGQSFNNTNNLQAGVRAGRQRPPQLLHARLHADQHHVRREVPDDTGEGEAVRRSRSRPGRGISPFATPAALRSPTGKRPRSARSSRNPCRTLSRCAPARCSSRNAAGRDSCRRRRRSRPRLSRSSRTRTARTTRRTSPCWCASSIATTRSSAS